MISVIIIFGVIAIVGFLLFHIMSRGAEGRDRRKLNVIKCIIPAICTVIIVLSLVFSGIQTVDSTEVGVVRTFGEINKQIDSGLNFVNPISDTVTIYDLRVHVSEAAFMSYTKDAQPLTSSLEYQYKLNPAYVMDIAREYGTQDILESKIDNVVQEKAKVVFAKYSGMSLLENRATLSDEVTLAVKELEELYHVVFTSVIIKDIDFSDAFEASVEAKMTAEQDALRAEQEKKTAIVKAEQEAEVAIIEAEQEAKTAAIEAEAAIARAKGEAEALDITRAALENMPDTWIAQQWIEAWDGKLPGVMSDGTNLMITPDM